MDKKDLIKVRSKYYDPYYILGVSKNDNIDQIKRAYQKRIKLFHPDKQKNKDPDILELHSIIIMESYKFLKKRLTENPIMVNRDDANIETSNETLPVPLTTISKKDKLAELKKEIAPPQKLFEKFSLDEFNKVFDYFKDEETDNVVEPINAADNHVVVAVYNGLMLTSDLYDTGSKISRGKSLPKKIDVKAILQNPKPSKIVEEKDIKHEIQERKKPLIGIKTKFDYALDEYKLQVEKSKEWAEKLKQDKEIIIKNKHLFPAHAIEYAVNKRLGTSEHYIGDINPNIPLQENIQNYKSSLLLENSYSSDDSYSD